MPVHTSLPPCKGNFRRAERQQGPTAERRVGEGHARAGAGHAPLPVHERRAPAAEAVALAHAPAAQLSSRQVVPAHAQLLL